MTKTGGGVEVGKLDERVEVLEFRQLPPKVEDPPATADEVASPLSDLNPPGASRHPPLTRGAEGAAWGWNTVRRTWGKVVLSERKNVYSVHGIGAAGVTITLRRQPLGLGSALCWRGQHCLITSIRPLGRLYLTVEAALVELYLCRNPRSGETFPAVMTEEYRGHDQLEPMAVNTHRRVLVTPKAVRLSPGPLVEVEGTPWPILTPYELDPHKNEYVVGRTVDL